MVLCAPAERPIEIVPEPEHPIPYQRDRRRCPLLETTVWIFAQVHEMPETASTVAGVPPLRLSNTHRNTTPVVGEKKFVVNDDAVPPFPVSRVEAARAGWSTVKSDELTAVPPGVVTEIGPVVAPDGTAVVIDVSSCTANDATTPLNLTEVVPVKFMPAIVTEAPPSPCDGSKLVIVGGGGGGTDGMINGDELIAPARRGSPK